MKEISQPIRRVHPGPGRDIAFSADGRFLIMALSNAILEIMDVASGSVLMIDHPKLGEAWSIGVAANSSSFALGFANGNIQIHDWDDGTIVLWDFAKNQPPSSAGRT